MKKDSLLAPIKLILSSLLEDGPSNRPLCFKMITTPLTMNCFWIKIQCRNVQKNIINFLETEITVHKRSHER